MPKSKVIDPVGQALTLAARRHRMRTAALLSEIGLFPGQEQVLQCLVDADGMTMSAIADHLNIKPPTASKMIARMAAQGLLERRGKDDDARLVAVFITGEGKSRIEGLRKISRRVEKNALDGLDEKEIRRLRRLLKKVGRNLGSSPDLGDDELAEIEA
jgi:DNA-binding MarR family transcriptional regulator